MQEEYGQQQQNGDGKVYKNCGGKDDDDTEESARGNDDIDDGGVGNVTEGGIINSIFLVIGTEEMRWRSCGITNMNVFLS